MKKTFKARRFDNSIIKLEKVLKPKIEIDYFIRRGIEGKFDTIYINAKPDMTISDVFDRIRRKYKNDKNISEIRLIDVEQIKSEL